MEEKTVLQLQTYRQTLNRMIPCSTCVIYLCENKLKVRGRKEGTHRDRDWEREIEREGERESEKKKLGVLKLGYKANLSS